MTVYIVDLESIPSRYTCEWKTTVPALIKDQGHKVEVISGPDDLPNNTTPGMFLNFSATNIYKAVQVEKFSRLFSDNKIKNGDHFLFTDAWHPGIINLKYMSDLLGIKITIHACWQWSRIIFLVFNFFIFNNFTRFVYYKTCIFFIYF